MRRRNKNLVNFLIVILILILITVFSILGSSFLDFYPFMIFSLSILIIYFILFLIYLYPRKRVLSKVDSGLIKKAINDKFVEDDSVEPVEGESVFRDIQMDDEMAYVGSKDKKKYHLNTCRFVKDIEEELKIESDERDFFVRQEYSACGVCKPDKK